MSIVSKSLTSNISLFLTNHTDDPAQLKTINLVLMVDSVCQEYMCAKHDSGAGNYNSNKIFPINLKLCTMKKIIK